MLNTLLKTLQEKSYETEEHTIRMNNMAWELGEKMFDSPEDQRTGYWTLMSRHDFLVLSVTGISFLS